MDNFKKEIEEIAGGEINGFAYYNAVKELSEEFGVPLECIDNLREYWFTKDDNVLTEQSKGFLRNCASTFVLLADNKESEE